MRLWSRFLVLVGLFALAVGCQSPLASLPSEDQHPELAVLKAQGAKVQRRTFYVPVEVAPGHVIQLAVHETGAFRHGRTLVLVHGVMSDSKIWRFVDAQWAKDYRVLAIDLPGCGESEKPDPSSLPPDAYGPESLARCVLAAARGRLGEGDEPVTLIGHSLGGLIVLRMFGDPQIRRDYNDVLARVDRLALFSPAHVAMEREPAVFQEIEHTDEISFELAAATGLLERRIAQSMRQSVSDPSLALREEAPRLSAILGSRQTRLAVRGMLHSALPRVGDRPNWEGMRGLAAGYARVNVLCLIVWGEEDETLSSGIGHMLRDDLPRARLRIVTHARHSLPTERPRVCVKLVSEFLAGAPGQEAARAPVSRIDGLTGLEEPSSVLGLSR